MQAGPGPAPWHCRDPIASFEGPGNPGRHMTRWGAENLGPHGRGGRSFWPRGECSRLERGQNVLHLIAFAAIGVVIGYLFAQGRRQGMPVIVLLALIGSFGAGLFERASKYGSIYAATIAAVILALAGRLAIKR